MICYFAVELETAKQNIMNTPFLTWSCILGLVVIAFVIDALRAFMKRKRRDMHIIEYGSEREIFYNPSDPDPQKVNDYDDVEDL